MGRRAWLVRVKEYLTDTEITHNYAFLVGMYWQGESPQRAAEYIINTAKLAEGNND